MVGVHLKPDPSLLHTALQVNDESPIPADLENGPVAVHTSPAVWTTHLTVPQRLDKDAPSAVGDRKSSEGRVDLVGVVMTIKKMTRKKMIK